MKITELALAGVKLVEPEVHGDSRGYFSETWQRAALAAAGIDADFVQDNESYSPRGVLRGLHFQTGQHAQAKLVRVAQGRVLDVCVDLRRGSATYGRHVAVELSSDNHHQLYVPRGFAHGFVVLSDTAPFLYKCDNSYAPQAEGGMRFDDTALGIDWRLPAAELQVNARDRAFPLLKDVQPQ